MRFADLIGLAFGALWQQKARTVMTTLGVVGGAFVLVISLSLGQGIQETIERESHRNSNLRRIDIWPHYRAREQDIPPEQVRVKGEMSEAKRRRLRQALVAQWLNSARGGPHTPLDRERLRALAGLEHVTAVNPLVQHQGWAFLNGQSHLVQTCSAAVDNAYCSRRVVAGRFFQQADERSAVVSEFLCYLAGVTDDADVTGVVGKKVRLEYRWQPPRGGLHLYLSKAGGEKLNLEEEVAVNRLENQLPSTLDRLDLSAEEKTVLRAALHETPRPPTVYAVELTVVGVVRQATEEDQTGTRDRFNTDADVLLPAGTAEAIFFDQPEVAKLGVDYVSLTVDREANVRGVTKVVSALGLEARSPLEFIDRERFIYLMIFGTMAVVAGVALLISALGIANTMLMSVLERTREIGIFKAVGAGDWHVQSIFLIEGTCIGLAGGVLGLLAAWGLSFPADAWIRLMILRDMKIELKESLFVFPWWLTAGVVAFAALVTTLAAVYPARRAARVEPLKALRHE